MRGTLRVNSFYRRSGGLFYHYLALKYRNTLWSPFKIQIKNWLPNTNKTNLVWIGSSSGYCVDQDWVCRFKQIYVYEIDPIARFILKRRFKDKNLILNSMDILKVQSDINKESWDPQNTFILFSNVLGQLPLENTKDTDWRSYFEGLKERLSCYEWASFHDRLSTKTAPTKRNALIEPAHMTSQSAQELAQFFFSGANSNLELLDHETEKIAFPQKPSTFMWWQLSKESFHLIEGVYSK